MVGRAHQPVNILLVDNEPAQLRNYEAILNELGENLIKASSARRAFGQLLKRDIAVVLANLCMPQCEGFVLAAMIRKHPRLQVAGIIFISASDATGVDLLRSYNWVAVDFISVPVLPELLRTKIKVFAELYRKARRLEELEQSLAERSTARAHSEPQLHHPPVLTERRRAEEARRKSEALAAVLDAAPNGMAMTDGEGAIVYANAPMKQLFGYQRDELLGQKVEMLIPERFHAGFRDKRRELSAGSRASRTNVGWELFGRRKDGSEFPVEISLNPVEMPEGPRLLASIIDVTERRRAQEALRKTEALASSVLSAALDAVVIVDHNGLVVEWNRAAEQVFGYSRGDTIGREIAHLIVPPRLQQAHRRGIARYLATGEGPVLGRLVELPAVRADGAEFPVEVYITPIPIEGPPVFTGFARDITERKAAEAALKESEGRLRLVTETAEVGHWDWDIASGRLYWSATHKRLFGLPEEAPISYDRFLAALHPEDRPRTERAIQACLEGKGDSDYDVEYRALWPDGTVRWLHAKGNAVFAAGRPVRMAGIVLDVTRRKQAEERLHEALRLASVASEAGRLGA
jgi:PAS domain S-box-containing protein